MPTRVPTTTPVCMHVYKNANHRLFQSTNLEDCVVAFFLSIFRMDMSLLCNEVWLMTPPDLAASSTNPDFEEHDLMSFATFLGKETAYLPQSTYFNLVQTHHSIRNARFRAVTWILKSQRRMDLCLETVFSAVNYLDRFISLCQCQEWKWKWWMLELLSVACLSIASKFNDSTAYLLHEFQEDLENSFDPNLIQRMELTVLKALDWRVDSTTPFSYIHLLIQTTTHGFNKTLVEELTQRVTQLLLDSLLDPKFLEFQQCVVAISAVRAAFTPTDNYASFAHLNTLIPQEYKDDLIRCQRLMEKAEVEDELFLTYRDSCSSPSSPVTVLKVELFNCYEFPAAAHLPLETNRDLRSSRKRKVEEVVLEEEL